MRRILLAMVMLLILLGIGGFIMGVPKSTAGAIAKGPEISSPITPEQSETIDGSVTPELIPDVVAYRMLFRVITNRQTETEKNIARDYLRHAGLGNQKRKVDDVNGSPDADIDALMKVAEEFNTRISVLDHQARRIKDRNWHKPGPPDSQTIAQLKQLHRQSETIVAEVVAFLPARLSSAGLLKLRQHINERVKRRIKIFPNSIPHDGVISSAAQHNMHNH